MVAIQLDDETVKKVIRQFYFSDSNRSSSLIAPYIGGKVGTGSAKTNDSKAASVVNNKGKTALGNLSFSNEQSKTKTPSPIPNNENISFDMEGAPVGRDGSPSPSGMVENLEQVEPSEQIHIPVSSQQPELSRTATPLDDNIRSEGNIFTNTDESSLPSSDSRGLTLISDFNVSSRFWAAHLVSSAITAGSPCVPHPPSRYEAQKIRDWKTFLKYLSNHKPPLTLSRCSGAHVIEFLRYLDRFGKTKVHVTGCPYFGHPNTPAPCSCQLKQAWGSLDALIGRLRAAYEENSGQPESNPFGARAVRIYLREVRESQAKARGVPYEKKRKRPSGCGMMAIAKQYSIPSERGMGTFSLP
ncbi:hypothetical protein CTI12_AA512170 [Artemisia annua]|uniref:ALOG domain-containing protein n=1 Tax=Artemisia annua TaxID=35608 RepID=A0A2U1LAR5_ARTAN|nr:hypothetical protein CTI12_AA512170 [Artemisia annua]